MNLDLIPEEKRKEWRKIRDRFTKFRDTRILNKIRKRKSISLKDLIEIDYCFRPNIKISLRITARYICCKCDCYSMIYIPPIRGSFNRGSMFWCCICEHKQCNICSQRDRYWDQTIEIKDRKKKLVLHLPMKKERRRRKKRRGRKKQ